MSSDLITSLLLNIAVGAYLAWGYPRTVEKAFQRGRLPGAFLFMKRVMPPIGKIIIVASVAYGLLVAFGVLS